MTIDDKILFLRAGYSKEEIESFETQATAPEAETQPAAPEKAPAWAAALQASIEKLVRVTQQGNVMTDDMGDAINTATSAEKALAKYLTGK